MIDDVHDSKYFEGYEEGVEYSDPFQHCFKPTILNNLPNLKNKRIYELGFGSGFCFKMLIDSGFSKYTGIDLSDVISPYLLDMAKKSGVLNKVKFFLGDGSQAFDSSLGGFDFVISTFCIFADSYYRLIAFSKHLYDALSNESGEVILAQIHSDHIWTPELIKKMEEEFCQFFSPRPKVGDRYSDFTPFSCELLPPFYKKRVVIDDCALSKETFIKALKEVGFKIIDTIEMITTPGKEHLLDFVKTCNWNLYRCRK